MLALRAAPAQAQAPSAGAAEILFREGDEAFRAGRTEEACEKFGQSYRIDPAPGTLKNLAICHETAGKTTSAWLEYLKLASLAMAAGKEKSAAKAREQADRLEAALSRVSIVLPAGTRVVTFEIDGVGTDVSALTTSLPLDPGDHTIHVIEFSGQQATVRIHVPAGPSTTSVPVAWSSSTAPGPSVKPPALPSTPGPSSRSGDETPDRPSESTTRRSVGWALVGGGLAGVAAGGVLGVAASAHKGDHPNGDAFTYATGSTIAFAAGVGSAATGAVLLFVPGSSPPASASLGWGLVGLAVGGLGAGGALGLVAGAHKGDHPNDDAFTFASASTVSFGVGLGAAALGTLFLLRSSNKSSSALRIEPMFAGGRGAGLRGQW